MKFSSSGPFLGFYLKKDTQNQHFCLLIERHDFACKEKRVNTRKNECCIRHGSEKVYPKFFRRHTICLPTISWLKHVVHATMLPMVKHSVTPAMPSVTCDQQFFWIFRVFLINNCEKLARNHNLFFTNSDVKNEYFAKFEYSWISEDECSRLEKIITPVYSHR